MLKFYKRAFMCSFILNLIMYLTLLPFSHLSILPLLFVSFLILNLFLSTHIFLSTPPCLFLLFNGLWPFPISSLPPLPLPWYLLFLSMLCFHFLSLPFIPSSPPLCTNASLLLQYLCVRGHCCGCRCPALSRRQSIRRGHGVRTRYSQGTVCTSCPGPPIAPTCCMSMPPGKTSNRAEPPPPTSECASHCLGWSNGICCGIDLLGFDVDMDGDSRMLLLWRLCACH